MFRHPNSQVYKSVVLTWITLSVASVVLAALNWAQLSSKLRASAQGEAIQAGADDVLKSMLDAETAVRGFTISGMDVFLQPFDDAQTRLPVQFNRLTDLTRQDPQLLKQVMDLRGQCDVLMELDRKLVTTRREEGDRSASTIVKTGDSREVMDDIRELIHRIKSAPAAMVLTENAESQSQLLRASLTGMVAGAIGVGAGVFALYIARLALKHQQRERELLEDKLQIQRASEEKSEFLANVSHEIRTPMNAILGFTDLLSTELVDPKHRQYLQSIRTSASSLLRLINDILDISKVEAGALELCPDPTDPREICDFITTLFAESAARKGLKLECKVAEDLPRALLLDRTRLRQILINLVGNAVKFTDRGGITATINWEKQPDNSSRITLIIEVQDTGVGIPQDKLGAIFKPFVQAGGHRDKEKMGTGLGLAIVSRLTQRMAGTVTVASVVGQGSVFRLRFPDVPVSVRLPVAEDSYLTDTANFNELSPAKILVVDDNEMNCQLIGGMFEGSHHQLEYGVDGREAVDKALSFRPHLLLLDIRMPNMDGEEALERIRRTQGLELLPIIAVTASNLMDEETKLREKFSGYLRKPFSRAQLFHELSQFLPRVEPAPGPDSAPERATPATVARAWRGLSTQLRGLEVQEWPGVRDSLAIRETQAFARKLEALARETNCEPLLTYAEAMARCASTYEVSTMEIHLKNFPAVIERVEQSRRMSMQAFITVMSDPAPDWDGAPPRILVADDQQYNIQVLGGILGRQGYEIIPASDGATALKRIALRPPDLILLDVLMPGMDGVEVCRRIRENADWKDIPIIFLSADDDKEMIVRALEAGGVDYVTKPFNHAEMLSRVRTHIALKRARDRLKQLAEDKDELLGILAHDLKSHLGGIQMSANLLQSSLAGTDNEKRQQLCENIYRSTSQLRVFVQEFLANSAADHGITLKSERVDLANLVTQAVQDYLEAARRKELTLEAVVPPGAVLVNADGGALRQVLDNLLSNAVKFSPHGKKIAVTVRSLEGSVECRVQDHGPGFNAEDKANMFQRYRRLSARPTGGEPSTGLGLSIVQKLVLAMHGDLACESEAGHGATFIMRFPKTATPN